MKDLSSLINSKKNGIYILEISYEYIEETINYITHNIHYPNIWLIRFIIEADYYGNVSAYPYVYKNGKYKKSYDFEQIQHLMKRKIIIFNPNVYYNDPDIMSNLYMYKNTKIFILKYVNDQIIFNYKTVKYEKELYISYYNKEYLSYSYDKRMKIYRTILYIQQLYRRYLFLIDFYSVY